MRFMKFLAILYQYLGHGVGVKRTMETIHQGQLAFIIGCIFSLFCAELPPFSSIIVLIVLAIYCFYRHWRITAGFIVGFCCFFAHAHWAVSWSLPEAVVKKPVELEGTVVDIAKTYGDITRFDLKLQQFDKQPLPLWQDVNIRVRWQHATFVPQVGDKLLLETKLKPPHGLANEGGFSYQKYLLTKRIRASGYVTHSSRPKRISRGKNTRQALYLKLLSATETLPYQGFLLALSVGDKQQITKPQWQTIQHAGISHLLAISGLHIGIVFALGCMIFRQVIALAGVLSAREFNSVRMALIGGLLSALFYAYLAGFAIATVRALGMLLIFVTGLWLAKNLNRQSVVISALFSILVVDPLAVLEPGLWLSAIAVLVIVLVFWWWPERPRRTIWGFLRPLIKIQLSLFVLMLPLSLVLFNGVSLAGIVVNLFAVPWVSMITVPLALLGALLELADVGGYWAFVIADKSVALLFGLIQWIPSGMSWHQLSSMSLAFLLFGVIFSLSLTVNLNRQHRALSLLLLLPLLLNALKPPEAFKVNVLDVGQGLSVVIESQGKVLVYDLGPHYQTGFNAVDAAVLPFLTAKGYRQVDTLIISHSDNDHAGNWRGFLTAMPVNRKILPRQLTEGAKDCKAGEFRWQGLKVEVLWPFEDPQLPKNTNDSSCVVRISNRYHSVLLPGDISKHVEARLIQHRTLQLNSTIIIAPHHGSNSSSSDAFIKAVAPHYVVYSSGFLNRYGFPRQNVVTRYDRHGVIGLSTATQGQVSFELSSEKLIVTTARAELMPHWYYNQ